MSKRDETTYKAKMNVKEDGYYTVYVNLYDDNRTIDRDYDMLFIER